MCKSQPTAAKRHICFSMLLCIILLLPWGRGFAQSVKEPDMVFVQGGTFTMGCVPEYGINCTQDERPAHDVSITGFQIAKYEVTQALWKQVMGSNPSRIIGDSMPVENVSWDDVQIFIKRLNELTGKKYRLPTEAEWEYAARGGQQSRKLLYSGSEKAEIVAWMAGNSGYNHHPVGTLQPNELGLYDMSGNVWEWCSDYYGSYPNKSQTNPTGPQKGASRVLRGGCYATNEQQCKISARNSLFQGNKDAKTGFRLALNDSREADAMKAANEAAAAEKTAEKERLAAAKKEEKEKLEAERIAEKERIEAEKQKIEEEKKAEAERLEAERIAEKERIEAERTAEKERRAAEKKEKEELNRKEATKLPLFALNVGGGAGYCSAVSFLEFSTGLDFAAAASPEFAMGLYGSYKTSFKTIRQVAAGLNFMMGPQRKAFLLGLGVNYGFRRYSKYEHEIANTKYTIEREMQPHFDFDLRMGGVFKGFYFFFNFDVTMGNCYATDKIQESLRQEYDPILQMTFNLGINFAQLKKKNKEK